MKSYLFLFIFVFLSCSKNDTVFEPQTETDILKYIEDNNLNATKSSSGLYYVINNEGTGIKPTSNSNVTVAYKGYFLDGNVFDQSNAAGISFGLNQVIKGWTEGLQLMVVGEKTRLFIPSELAYGNRAAGAIGPGSTLIFEVELLGINE